MMQLLTMTNFVQQRMVYTVEAVRQQIPLLPSPLLTGWHTGVSNSIMGDVTEVGLIRRNSGIIVLSVLILRGVPLKDTDDDGVVLYDDADRRRRCA